MVGVWKPTLIVISILNACLGADFNEAFAASVHSNVVQLVTLPWNRINAVLFSAFNSKWTYVYSGDGITDARGPEAYTQYVDQNHTQEFLWSVFKPILYEDSSSIDMVYYGFENGMFIAYSTPFPGVYHLQENGNMSCPGYGIDIRCRKSYAGNSTDKVTGIIDGPSTRGRVYDPRLRVWYTDSVSKGSVWTAPYVFTNYGVLGVTAAQQIITHDGRFIGVIGTDYSLASIETILISLVASYSDISIFIVDNLGNLIATSTKGGAIDENNAQIPANMSSDPRVCEVAKVIEKDLWEGGLNGWVKANGTVMTVDIAGWGMFWAQSTELTDEYGLHWHVVVVESVSCETGFFAVYEAQMFDKNDKNRGGVCKACPEGAECAGDNYFPYPKKDHWMEIDFEDSKVSVSECVRETCVGFEKQVTKRDNYDEYVQKCFTKYGNPNSSAMCHLDNLMCARGSTGPICGSCLPDYKYHAGDKRCEACASDPLVPFIPIIIIAGLMAVVAFLHFNHIFSIPTLVWESWPVMVGRHLFKTGTLKVLISTYQIIQSVTYSLQVAYPSTFAYSLRMLGFLAMDMPGLECGGVGVYDRVYFASIAPVVLALMIIIAGKVRIMLAERRLPLQTLIVKRRNIIIEQTAWALLFLSYLVLPPVTAKQLEALDCFPLKGSRKYVLRMDTGISCESKAHQQFVLIDSFLIVIYLTIPVIWVVLLYRQRRALFPIGITEDAIIIQRRKTEPSLLRLKFLFERYKPRMVNFESLDMLRRIMFVGVVPLMATSSLMRSAIGVGFSLVFLMLNRELAPYISLDTNVVAYIADVVIYCTFASALLIETGLNDGVDNLLFGVILIVVNFSVLAVGIAGAIFRTKIDREYIFKQREKGVKKIEDACDFSASQFGQMLEEVNRNEVLPSYCMVFIYGSLLQIRRILRHGIPVSESSQGIKFTMHHPHSLTTKEKKYFQSTEAFIVCSISQRLLQPVLDSSLSAMWYLPHTALLGMRGIYFGDLSDAAPWEEGLLLLPPQCIKRAYQIEDIDLDALNKSIESAESDKHKEGSLSQLCKNMFKNNPFSKNDFRQVVPITGMSRGKSVMIPKSKTMIVQDESPPVTIKFPLENTSIKTYIDHMKKVRVIGDEMDLLIMYHYTDLHSAELISKGGFVMSERDAGNLGVHFTLSGPSSYDVGSPNYEKNIIADFYGRDLVAKHSGINRFEVCLVYGIDASLVELTPGSTGNLVHVPKTYFQDLALCQPDGRFFLRSDRILGAFRFNIHNQYVGLAEMKDELSLQTMADNEAIVMVKSVLAKKVEHEMLIKSMKESVTNTLKIEWAVTYSPFKFSSIFNEIKSVIQLKGYVLCFYYGTLAEVENYLSCGIPVKRDVGGGNILFTLHQPDQLTKDEMNIFTDREAFIVSALPSTLLVKLLKSCDGRRSTYSADTELYALPSSVLRSMRSVHFNSVNNPEPWRQGALMLSTNCFKSIYQIDEKVRVSTLSNSIEMRDAHRNSHGNRDSNGGASGIIAKVRESIVKKSTSRSKSSISDTMAAIAMSATQAHGVTPPSTPPPLSSNSLSISSSMHVMDRFENDEQLKMLTSSKEKEIDTISSFAQYDKVMKEAKSTCAQCGLIPVYFYTDVETAQLILVNGFKMFNSGVGGVFFSLYEPSAFHVMTPEYEKKVIVAQYGENRFHQLKGQKLFDVCLVYAIDPLILTEVNTGVHNGAVARKSKDFDIGMLSKKKSVIWSTFGSGGSGDTGGSSFGASRGRGGRSAAGGTKVPGRRSSGRRPSLLSFAGNNAQDLSTLSENNEIEAISGAVHVMKEYFHDFSLPSKEGRYFLRSDFILGAYAFNAIASDKDQASQFIGQTKPICLSELKQSAIAKLLSSISTISSSVPGSASSNLFGPADLTGPPPPKFSFRPQATPPSSTSTSTTTAITALGASFDSSDKGSVDGVSSSLDFNRESIASGPPPSVEKVQQTQVDGVQPADTISQSQPSTDVKTLKVDDLNVMELEN